MRKYLFLFALASIAIFSCNSYGEKVKINDKSEVYYKDGATKEEAQKLGDYLLKENYFDTKSEKSVQLTKSKDTFNVKFVVDKEMAQKEISATESTFTALGLLLSYKVFSGKPTKVMLADQYMKTFKEMPAQSFGVSPSDSTGNNTTSDSSNAAK